MKIQASGIHLRVMVRRPDIVAACKTIEFNAVLPPDGYKWIDSSVKRRGRSGTGINLSLRFVHCDPDFPQITHDEAAALFSDAPGALSEDPDPPSASPPGT